MTPKMKKILDDAKEFYTYCNDYGYPSMRGDPERFKEFIQRACVAYAANIIPAHECIDLEMDMSNANDAFTLGQASGFNACRDNMISILEQDSLDLPTN